MNHLRFQRLDPATISPAEMAALTAVVLGAPAYAWLVDGRAPEAASVPALLTDLPPTYTQEDKYFYAIYQGEQMIACADILRGWKHPQQSMLGLLLIAEAWQGQGLGRRICSELEGCIAAWPAMRSIRLAVVSSNLAGLAFWRTMGYLENGERVPSAGQTGDLVIFEKEL